MPFDSDSAKQAARKRWDTPAAKVAKADKPVKADPYVELGNRNLHTPRGWDRLEFLPQLRGRRGSEIYREMFRNDAIVSAILFEITMLLRRVEWTCEPTPTGDNGEVSDQDIERADFLSSCMDDLSHSWEEFIADALTMLPFGFAAIELVYKKRETTDLAADASRRTRHPDGKVGWRKLVLIPQATVQDFTVDEFGGVQAIQQGGVYGVATVDIPIEKLVLFRTDRNTPRGESVLRGAVESWYYRKRIRESEGIGIERDLAGLPVIYAQPDYLAKWTTDLQDLVRNIRNDEQAGVLLPDLRDEQGNRTVTLELLSSGGARQFDTDTIIARYTREIAMSLLQDTILLGHEKVGTQALAREKRDLSDTALQAWLNDIAATINDHAVPRLFALNGEDLENLPRLVPGDLHPTDVNEFALALKDIAAAGFMLAGDPEVEAFVRRRLGLPAMAEEVQQMMTEDMLNPPEPVMVTPDGGPVPDEEKSPPEKTAKAMLIERDADGVATRFITGAHTIERDADGRIAKIVEGI